MRKIKVLVVDDSRFLRRTLPRILSIDPEIEVVGVASNGKEAVDMTTSLEPDVITMDIVMPVMDGITALKEIMELRPTPVVMLSSLTYEGAEKTIEALSLGAVDYVHKPSGQVSLDISRISKEIIQKVKNGSKSKIGAISRIVKIKPDKIKRVVVPKAKSLKSLKRPSLIAIATSAGGPSALRIVLGALPKKLCAGIVIVQHIIEGFDSALAESLDSASELCVKVAEDLEEPLPGKALIAPSGCHVIIAREEGKIKVRLLKDKGSYLHMPSADILFFSLADTLAEKSCGVILTGMGSDGAKGIEKIHKRGGITIAQDEATSLIFGMPKKAIEKGAIDIILPIEDIPLHIIKSVGLNNEGER